MSKGTKVLRFGRIQKIIDRLKMERAFYVSQLALPSTLVPDASRIYYNAQIERIDSTIMELEALGE